MEMETDADNVLLLETTTDDRVRKNGCANPAFGILHIDCGPAALIPSEKLDCRPPLRRPSPELAPIDATAPRACNWTAAVLVVIVTATLITVLFPNVILQTINDQSDAYCAIFFVSLASWLLMAIVVVAAKVLLGDGLTASLRPSVDFTKIVKLSVYYGISGLAVFYGRDRFRVICHLQDPLSAAILPFAVICHLLLSAKVDSVRKLACISVAIIGLFVCVDYQIWDEFSCPGHIVTTLNGDGMFWTSDEHIVWTVVYLIGLALLALFYTLLDKSLNGSDKMSSNIISTVSMSSSVVETKPSLMNSLVLCTWIQFFSWITVAVLFWTDLFSFLGRPVELSTGGSSFAEMMLYGNGCFLGIGEDCSRTATLVWTFVILSSILFVALVYVISYSADTDCSVAYTFSLVTLALPFSTLWWSVFKINADGLHWSPTFNGETGFTLVGLPVMIFGVVLYRRCNGNSCDQKPSFANA